MDERRFDAFVRVLGEGISRRQTLAVIGSMLAGEGLLAALPEGAMALSKKARRRCERKAGVVCSAGTKRSECCATKHGPHRPATCVNGACSCNAEFTFEKENGCPKSADGRCACLAYVGAEFLEGACTDPNEAVDPNSSCTSNLDCGPGSFCVNGTGQCSNPCKPR